MMLSSPQHFDVFLSYHSQDRDFVQKLRKALLGRGLNVWMDEWEIRPGARVQEALELGLLASQAAAVLIGSSGLGPWEKQEMRACISLAVEQKIPVIPVFLPGAPTAADLPLFLKDFSRLDMRSGLTEEALTRFEWGIRGAKSQPEPTPDLKQQLDEAKSRLGQRMIAGEDITPERQEILALRRELREGRKLQVGSLLAKGRFQLAQILGRGGFASVWKAFDKEREQLVAVKVLHGSHVEDRTRRERFFRGARRMADLQHPGIVRVIEAHLEDREFHFFVMEYVKGGDLRQAVLRGQLLPEQALPVILKVGEALEYAHEKGLIHRDVKPGNILLDEDRPKLTDFDLVRASDSTGGTNSKDMLGTFLYAAPEVLRDANEANASTDVFSLAMTAVFALHGGDLPPDVYRDADPILANLSCSEGLRKVLRRAISWIPSDRPSSAGEFRRDLAALTEAIDPVLPPRAAVTAAAAKSSHWQRPIAGEPWTDAATGVRFLWIPGGRFEMGGPVIDNEKPSHWVRISPFWLGETPVTHGQYGVFLKETGGKEPEYWRDRKFSDSKQPVVGVSWNDAMEFCAWLSTVTEYKVTLAREAQWEFAARGLNGREYPWGNEAPDPARACYDLDFSKGKPAAVGLFPLGQGPFGTLDQAGNVWEWCLDGWDPDAYAKRARGPEPVDPLTPVTPDNPLRVLRGGCWFHPADRLRAAFRSKDWARLRNGVSGFRVAAASPASS